MARPVSEWARIRREPERAVYDEASVHGILDAGFVCHVGVVRDGRPVVVPTLYARDGDRLLLHGSPVAGMFRAMQASPRVCVTVTHVDGLVLARSVFHHSVNYRSVVVHGVATPVTGEAELLAALRVLVEHIAPGQWAAARLPNDAELRQTSVWQVGIEAASAKVRTGGPADEAEDYALPVWAGVLPMRVVSGPLQPDARVPAGVPAPAHLLRLAEGTAGVAADPG